MSNLSEALERQLRKLMPQHKSLPPVPKKKVETEEVLAEVVRSIHLVYQEGSSDKEYKVQIVEVRPTRFEVTFQYGRIGNKLIEGKKTSSPVSISTAVQIYEKLVKEKQSKGYTEK
jgi:predicted DNA-binding WGR domain protein